MIKALKPYPYMKDSGVEWLGQVPEHWSLPRMKTVLRERSQKGFPDEPLLAATQSKGVVRKEEFENRTVLALKDLHLLKLVCVNDFVISLRSFQGGIEYARERGIISPAYTILYPVDPEIQSFLSILFKSKPFIQNLGLYVTGIRQGQNIDYEKLSRSRILLPPLPEQTAIVKYLNHVDRKVKRFIRAKRKLIALLEEQKQVIIHNAVTRGLDLDVSMKDSGVEWLGEVPEHWEVVKVKQVSKICRGKFTHRPRNDPSMYDGAYPFIQTGDVARAGKVIEKYSQSLNERGLKVSQMFPKGTLVMTIAANIGDVAILDFEACFPDSIVGFIPGSEVRRDYLFYLFQAMRREFLREAPVNTQGNLNIYRIGSRSIPLPSVVDQDIIVAQIETEIRSVSNIITRITREIELLNEYRTRLISDVVTGKLDVREAAAGLPDEEENEEQMEMFLEEEEGELEELSEMVEEEE